MHRFILAGANYRGRGLAGLGAVLGIAITSAICALVPAPLLDFPLIIGPIGASAVLVFAVPASPLAQPWPVIGGSMIGALVGVATYRIVPDVHWAAGIAVGAAILIMTLARALHPPGGAAALTAVIGSDAIHQFGYSFALIPIGLNTAVLVTGAIAYHRLTGRNYPHKIVAAAPIGRRLPVEERDIEAALVEAQETFDISPEDLKALIQSAERHADRRRAQN